MLPHRHRLRFLAVLAVFAVIGVACSAGTPTPTVIDLDVEGPDATDAVEAAGDGVDRVVDVTLGDSDSGEFTISMKETSFLGGETVRFNVTNAGVVQHEFRLSNTDRIEEHLGAGHSDEDHQPEAGGEAMGTGVLLSVGHNDEPEMEEAHDDGVEDMFIVLDAGDSGELTVTFPEDDHAYTVAACLVPGHYEAGMYMAVQVIDPATAALDGGLQHTQPSEDLAALADRKVDVTLGGVPGEYEITMDSQTFLPGETVLFHIVNAGDFEHEFRLSNQARIDEHVEGGHGDHDDGAGDEDMADMEMEEGSEHEEEAGATEEAGHDEDEGADAHADEAEDFMVLLQPGQTGELLVSFPENAVDYSVAACLVPGHYEAGMSTDVGVGVEVEVTLAEFAIEMSQADFEVGVPYRFVVRNEGDIEHEMMIMSPLEPGAMEGMDMEMMDELALLVFEADDLQPDAVASQTFTFPEGGDIELEAVCLIPGHYEAGMVATVFVTG